MERKIITTGDGSKTIQITNWDEQYHSKHGAVQEAYHVFIKMGLLFQFHKTGREVNILEIGFGTGLNAYISFLEAEKLDLCVHYTGVEAYPISSEEVEALNYVQMLKHEAEDPVFDKIHEVGWEGEHYFSPFFILKKQQKLFQEIKDEKLYNLIYFDAFGARVQPNLWTEDIFQKMFTALQAGGALVTYAAKGSVRRAMETVGFLVERLPGPPGKREMLRGIKPL